MRVIIMLLIMWYSLMTPNRNSISITHRIQVRRQAVVQALEAVKPEETRHPVEVVNPEVTRLPVEVVAVTATALKVNHQKFEMLSRYTHCCVAVFLLMGLKVFRWLRPRVALLLEA